MVRAALAAALLLIALPLASAQTHEHGGGKGAVMILHDGPVDGRAVVGAYSHFGFALLDKDASPTPHQDAEFTLTQNGNVLFSTTNTHEYDGLFSFDFTFTKPGNYTIMGMSGDMMMGWFNGTAVMPVNATEGKIDLKQNGDAFELSILDPSGALIDHSDAIVEFRSDSDDTIFARTHLHSHTEKMTFTQALPGGQSYTANVIGYIAYATGKGHDMKAVTASFPATGGFGMPAVPMPEIAPPKPLNQVGDVDVKDNYALHLMYDPNQQVGMTQIARIAGAFIDINNHTTKQHVNFEFDLAGPTGTVFSSKSLHEYDGVFEYLFRPAVPGFYDGTMTAVLGDAKYSVPVHLEVVPPVLAGLGGEGPINVMATGLDKVAAWNATNITFSAMGPAGPAMHSEVDVTIFHDKEAPIYQFKLHTHESGTTNAVVVFPHPGDDWKIRIDSMPTDPEASIYPMVEIPVKVGAALAQPIVPAALDNMPQAKVPAPGLLSIVVIAGAAVLVVGRRIR